MAHWESWRITGRPQRDTQAWTCFKNPISIKVVRSDAHVRRGSWHKLADLQRHIKAHYEKTDLALDKTYRSHQLGWRAFKWGGKKHALFQSRKHFTMVVRHEWMALWRGTWTLWEIRMNELLSHQLLSPAGVGFESKHWSQSSVSFG